MRSIFFIFLCIISISCQPVAEKEDVIGQEYPEIESEIKSLVDQIFTDGADKKLEELDAYHLNTPKFSRIEDNGILNYQQGKELEEAFYGGNEILSWSLPQHKVDVFGDMAISSFHIDMQAVIGQDTVDMKAKASLIFADSDGEWKIVHEHISLRQ